MMPYIGLWKRTLLLEPKSDPEGKEIDMICHWIQSKSGMFIDLRVPIKTSQESSACQLLWVQSKSFSGISSFDFENSTLRWNRVFDFRLIPAEDVGIITELGGNIIQEDSALEGDDYREIWERIDQCTLGSEDIDIACCLYGPSSTSSQNKILLGYFVQVNNFFAVTLGYNSDVKALPSLDKFRRYFQFGKDTLSVSECEEVEDHLQYFVSCFGVTEDWKVVHSLNPVHVGESLDAVIVVQRSTTSGVCLRDLLRSLQWEVVCGTLPSFLDAL